MKRFKLVTAEEWAFRGFCLAAGASAFVFVLQGVLEGFRLLWR